MGEWLLRVVGAWLLLGLQISGPGAAWADETPLQSSASEESTFADAELSQPLADPADIRRYRDVIANLELEGGAYNPGLAEPLLDLGNALKQSGLHAEAIDLLKRCVHVSRVNDGLYSQIQLSALESEIESHIAIGQFKEADKRQRYLYRVQQRSLSGDDLARALGRQAHWQRRAWELRLDDEGFSRLYSMWNLHRMALAELVETYGEESPRLLQPLHGMLEAQYLMSRTSDRDRFGRFQRDTFRVNPSNRGPLAATAGSSYRHGDAVIRAIYELESAQPESTPMSRAEVHAMMGDWRLWHGRYNDALDAYADAIIELAASGSAKEDIEALLGSPVPLPAIESLQSLPERTTPEEGNLLLEFSVDEHGKVRNLQRLDDNEVSVGFITRLRRTLRGTPFRPRFETGEPVTTTGILWAYDTNQRQ